MKRIVLHLLFWFVYLALRSYIEYLWATGLVTGFTTYQLIVAATKAAVLESLPEVFFAYYFSYRILYKITIKNNRAFLYILEAVIILLIGIYSVRGIFITIIASYVYLDKFPASPVFEFKRFMSILFNFVATTGLVVAIKSVRSQLIFKEREKNLIKEKLETELKLLRNQINPHFLFNTLNNIYALSRKKSDITPTAIMKLSELLSFMLYRSGEERIPVEEEIKIIQDYIELEQLRYNSRLSIQFTRQIDNPQQLIAPLLLLPLIENAFKHGISESRFESFVHIRFQLRMGYLEFDIENSVEQLIANTPASRIGLYSTQRQLELMYADHKITIDNDNTSFKVGVKINLNSYERN